MPPSARRLAPIEHRNFWQQLDRREKSRRPATNVTVRSEADLDEFLSTHPTICSLPADKEDRVDLSKLAPKDKRFVYIMMDSGASLHAADKDKHFEGYELFETEESRRGDFAFTANGDKLYNLGRFDVTGVCNGVKLTLGFTHMKVDVPVASVRTFVRNGNDVQFFEGGGRVTNRENGAQLPIVEMGGVYFLKLKIRPPKSRSPDTDMVFARPA